MGINAFTPMGNTVKIAGATSAPSASQVPSSTGSSNQYRIINSSGTQGAFLAWGSTASEANTNCVIPTGSGVNSQKVVYLLPNTDEVLTFLPNAYFTAITSLNTADIYIIAGDGL
jgi:hypothetical protein